MLVDFVSFDLFLFASFWLRNFRSPRGKQNIQYFLDVKAIRGKHNTGKAKQFLRGYTLKQKQTNNDAYAWSLVVTVKQI